jgi:electron transport complex protein RnfG
LKKKQDWLILGAIAIVAAVLLAGTNVITKDRIAEQALLTQHASRIAALPGVSAFEEMTGEEAEGIDNCYAGLDANGSVMGYVVQTTVKGYGGEIEVMVGVDAQGTITGLAAGGSNFSETAGVGTRVQEEAFSSTFIGLTATPVAGDNVETLSGATVSSRAVIGGAAVAYDHAAAHLAGE